MRITMGSKQKQHEAPNHCERGFFGNQEESSVSKHFFKHISPQLSRIAIKWKGV